MTSLHFQHCVELFFRCETDVARCEVDLLPKSLLDFRVVACDDQVKVVLLIVVEQVLNERSLVELDVLDEVVDGEAGFVIVLLEFELDGVQVSCGLLFVEDGKTFSHGRRAMQTMEGKDKLVVVVMLQRRQQHVFVGGRNVICKSLIIII